MAIITPGETLFVDAAAQLNPAILLADAIGIALGDTPEQVLAKLISAAAPSAQSLTETLLAAILAEDTDTINLADAIARVLPYAGPTGKLATLAGYAAMSVEDRALAFGEIFRGPDLDGPANPGEFLVLDDLGAVTGAGFTAASAEDILSGAPGILPQDPEAMKLLRDYADVAGDISSNDLVLDFSTGTSKRFDFSANLDLGVLALPADFLPGLIVGTVLVHNSDLSNPRTITFAVSGTLLGETLADLVLYGAAAATLEIAADGLATLYFVATNTGELQLHVSVPA